MLLADRIVPWTTSSLPPGPAHTWHHVDSMLIASLVFAFLKEQSRRFQHFLWPHMWARHWNCLDVCPTEGLHLNE